MTRLLSLSALLLLCACDAPPPEGQQAPTAASPVPEDSQTATLPIEIDPPQNAEPGFPTSFRALGTEPFWAVHVSDGRLRYMTPEDPQGEPLEFTREQTARDEIAISATLGEEQMILSGRIAECSDGMSEREYPFTVTLRIGERTLNGCARPTEP